MTNENTELKYPKHYNKLCVHAIVNMQLLTCKKITMELTRKLLTTCRHAIDSPPQANQLMNNLPTTLSRNRFIVNKHFAFNLRCTLNNTELVSQLIYGCAVCYRTDHWLFFMYTSARIQLGNNAVIRCATSDWWMHNTCTCYHCQQWIKRDWDWEQGLK